MFMNMMSTKTFLSGVDRMTKQSESRSQEQRRVDDIIKQIKQKEEKLYAKSSGLKHDVVELRKNFWEDVTVNLEELDDVIETQASIKQQAELLSERERTHGKITEELNVLHRLKDSPYFGRIDFTEVSGEETEKIYIGTASFMDPTEEEFLIYDWRAPIASLYYDYGLGKATYETISREITGNISLKRQFMIRQGTIKGMFDTGITIGDHLLQKTLGNNASTTMKSIVATIQKEQNKIIRNERSKLLVVQGVAGSGKTSAVLQRIAYLLYRYRGELHSDNMLLLSPNPLFSSYIANVLPELGEANIQQMTFLHFLRKQIGKNFTIESPFEQMEYLLTAKNDEETAIRRRSIAFKSSLTYMNLLDEFIKELADTGIQFRNITFQERILISKEQISNYFYELDKGMTIPNRMEQTAKWLLKKLQRIGRSEKKQDWVMERVELLDKETYLQAYYQHQQQNEDDARLEEKILRTEVIKRTFHPIMQRVKRYQFVNILATFEQLFTKIDDHVDRLEYWADICKQTTAYLSQRYLPWEEVTPFLYFKDALLGNRGMRRIRHLFIDEAQDYSAFQFAYLKQLFPYTWMTLLGDINQSIYTYATNENPLIANSFENKMERITLSKSYRSTKQIVEFTKSFAPGTETIEPFDRDGSVPTLVRLKDKADFSATIVQYVKELQTAGQQTIGIICKTMRECKALFETLKEKMLIKQMNEQTYHFETGVLLLPVYLAKGIEFDAVIVPNASKQYYASETDRNLFYTACTRAMHALVMMTTGEPSSFILEAPNNTYQISSC